MRLKYLNFDNNSDYFTSHPVVLTPQQKTIFKDRNSNRYLFNIVVVQNMNA